MARVFQKDKPGRNITIMSGSEIGDLAFFLECLGYTAQRFVCQLVGLTAVPAIKVQDQPAAQLKIYLPSGAGPLVQPFQKLSKCVLSRCPGFFQLSPSQAATILTRRR